MRFVQITADDPRTVAAAARTTDAEFVLLVEPHALASPGALDALHAAVNPNDGVVGGARCAADVETFGWMLAPCAGPLPFELSPIALSPGANDRASVRGAVDVVVPGMVLAARELVLEPLPREPVAAMLELCARARAAGRDVRCLPAFAFHAAALDADDRGRLPALRAVAERRPEVRGAHRLPPGWRRTLIERETRMPGGFRSRVRVALPPLTVLVHGAGAEIAARRARTLAPHARSRAVDDAAVALRDELRVRGDRYVLVASSSCVPDANAFDALVDAIEASAAVAIAAPSASALDGSCVLIAPGRIPQHVDAPGTTIADATAALAAGARAMRRAVRAPGLPAELAVQHPAPATTSVVFLASSLPEVLRVTLAAVIENTRPGDDVVAVTAPNAATSRRLLAAYPHVRLVEDAADPLLSGALNRAAGAARGDVVAILADDVLLPAGSLERLRDAFARVPSLGAALPAVPGAPGGEGRGDVTYTALSDLRALAQRRAVEYARETEPIDVAVTPAIVVARAALHAVGGVDPSHGPTRRGIADLVLRLRGAGYGVVRCDDVLAHRFPAELSHNPAAAADARTPLPAADVAAIARGFDPRGRVPFDAGAVVAPSVVASHAIAVPVADAHELDDACAFVAAAAAAFDVRSPVRIHLVLDGDVTPAECAARVRGVLAGSRRPLDETVAVRIERAAEVASWREGLGDVRLLVAAGHERGALSACARVGTAQLRTLLEPVLR